MTIIGLALKELRHSMKSLRLIAAILFLGFVGPLAVSALKTSVADYLVLRSRQILSADLAVSSVRPLSAEERTRIKALVRPVRQSEEVELVTMARAGEASALIDLRAVDAAHPVFGDFALRADAAATAERFRLTNAEALSERRIAWVFPEVLSQLGVRVGDRITIGRSEFEVRAVIDEAPGAARGGIGFAPRVYIGRSFVDESGLLGYGSQIFYRHYLGLPQGVAPDLAAARIKHELADPDIFLRTPDDSIQGMERFFRFFNLYLVMIAMAVFALSWASAFYILEVYLEERLKNAAVLFTMGASRAFVSVLYAIEILAVLGVSFALSLVAVDVLVVTAPSWLSGLLPAGFALRVGGSDVLTLVVVALASAVAFLLPLWIKLAAHPLNRLLGESALAPATGESRWLDRLGPAVAFGIFLGLSIWLMDSFEQALKLMLGLALVTAVGWGLGRFLFRTAFAALRGRPGLNRLVVTNLARGRFGTNLGFLTLLLVTLILNLVPHLLRSVVAEVGPESGRQLPALFLFNVPESSIEELTAKTAELGAEVRYVSPLVLARLTAVNGREPESENFQRFPVRISYRAGLLDAEGIVAGRPFDGAFDPRRQDVPGLSVEEKFAERNGFKIGDELAFDVQGITVKGRIENLRRVRWTEFNPNFFLLFQPGVLEDAPKTYLANVFLAPGSNEESKTRLQSELLSAFPDVSVIDIGRTIARVFEIVDSVLGPLRAAAALAVTMSFLVLLGVVAHNLALRRREVEIEKLLGADRALVEGLVLREYAWTAVLAWSFGALGAIVLTGLVTWQIFDVAPKIDVTAVLASGAVVITGTLAVAKVSVRGVLGLRGTSSRL